MLSERFYLILTICMPLCEFFGVTSFLWDRSCRLLRPSRKAMRLLRFNFLVLLNWIMYATCQTVRFHLGKNYDAANLLTVFTAAASVPLILNWIFLFYRDDLLCMSNGFILYCQHMTPYLLPKRDPNTSQFNKLIDLFTVIIILGGAFGSLLLFFFYFIFPTNPTSFANVIPPHLLSLPLLLLIISYHCYLSTILQAVVGVYAVFTFNFFVILTPFVVQEFRLGRKKYNTVDKLRQPVHLMQAYRSTQILFERTMSLIGRFLVPLQGSIMLLIIFCNVMLIRHWADLQLTTKLIISFWGVLINIAWCFVLTFAGLLHRNGQKMLASWGRANFGSAHNNKLMKKFKRSCKPVMVHYGSCFVIKRITVLIFMRGVIRGTMRVLLTTKK